MRTIGQLKDEFFTGWFLMIDDAGPVWDEQTGQNVDAYDVLVYRSESEYEDDVGHNAVHHEVVRKS